MCSIGAANRLRYVFGGLPAFRDLLATGEGGLTTDYAKTYGPDPALVRSALAAIRRAGLRTSWTPGQGTASVAGKVSSVDHLFHVRLSLYETPGSLRFFAANREDRAERRAFEAASRESWTRE